MPRIDPLQLLKCLSVLLAPNGGILSKDQVCRLASLMTKFSKKLVSKCIYVQILKNTKTELIGMFMSEGGWGLTNSWLADAIEARNWPLMQELLELLLMCPVDVERLKLNNCPKLVKGLSKDPTNKNVQMLATRLVEQWLQIVKGHGVANQPLAQPQLLPLAPPQVAIIQPPSQPQVEILSGTIKDDITSSPLTVPEQTLDSTAEEVPSDSVDYSEVKSDHEVQLLNPVSTVPSVEVEPVCVKDEGEPMDVDLDSGTVSNGEPQDKIVLKISKDGNKVVIRSPVKRVHSEEDDEASPAKRKAKDTIKEKKKIDKERTEKEKSDKEKSDKEKSVVKHEKLEKPDKKLMDRRPSKDSHTNSLKDAHKSDSKSKHHHSDKLKEKDKDRTKDREKVKSSISSNKDKEKLKEKSKETKDKDKNKEKVKEKTETQADKDRATLAKIMQPSLSKLGKIPKKTDSSSKPSEKVRPPIIPESKKISISIESRKNTGEARPKTVKTFNSKFRSTGLEEEVKPPPSRKEGKKNPSSASVLSTGPVEKKDPLLSSQSTATALPEKRTKPILNLTGPAERPGAIKLIPPKPKPAGLQDSDFFMDALTAANVKREPKKKVKRRTSGSKDEPTSPTTSANTSTASNGSSSPGSPASSPERPTTADPKPVFKFYQETLQLNEDIKTEEEDDSEGKKQSPPQGDQAEEASVKKERDDDGDEKVDKSLSENSPRSSPVSHASNDDAMRERERNRLPKGVLVFHRSSRGPKKSLKWRAEPELESVHYFELDETERVNVTKTSFMDMKQMERIHERENFHLARRMSGEDQMREHTSWSRLIPIDLPPSEVEPGCKSREKDIQFAREKTVPASPFFGKNMGPDAPSDPDYEHHQVSDPVIIPLEDVTGPNTVNDFTSTPWPEPKPLLIPQSPPHTHTISHQVPVVPVAGATSSPLLHTPPFHSSGGDWRSGDGKVVIPDMPMVGMNPSMVPMGPTMGPALGQGMMGPGMGHGMGPGMGMGGPAEIYNNQNGMDGNWGPDMNYGMMGGGGPDIGGPYPMDQGGYDMYQGGAFGPGPGGHGGPHMGPGNFRGRGGRGWYRGGSENWRGNRGRGTWGGPGGPKRVPPICRYFKKGNCQTVNCMFQHPAELKSGRH